ncbi:hypothetical protein ACIA6T_32320 [Streptomyces sp. NPDC051740]|uniref:hypothetical protein n=1 Tax=Streptomyces sp. NPDC051740 TaxID=3365673 RepID=UPI00378808EE
MSIAMDGTIVEKGFLSSVKGLGDGIDTMNCDSVHRADVLGSRPGLVQAVGRALRMQPGEGPFHSLDTARAFSARCSRPMTPRASPAA